MYPYAWFYHLVLATKLSLLLQGVAVSSRPYWTWSMYMSRSSLETLS